jgi:Cutinase
MVVPPAPKEHRVSRVLIIGLRGSSESDAPDLHRMGPTVDAIAQKLEGELRRRQPGIEVDLLGIDYPAETWRYFRSRDRGVRVLVDVLNEVPADQVVVLIGLSQGADVIQRASWSPELRLPPDALAAVILLGDPTRHPEHPYQHGTGDRRPGVLAAREKGVPESWWENTWSYCLDGDRVSAYRYGWLGLIRSGAHTHYVRNVDGLWDQAVSFALNQVLTVRAVDD